MMSELVQSQDVPENVQSIKQWIAAPLNELQLILPREENIVLLQLALSLRHHQRCLLYQERQVHHYYLKKQENLGENLAYDRTRRNDMHEK